MKNDIRLSSTNKECTIENIMNSFPGMYLTMISIVQGVALGILFYKSSTLFPELTKLPIKFSTFYIPLTILTTFLFIILTWHSYFWLAAIARWVPLIWDSILFFIFGAFEFILIESLNGYNTLVWFYLFSVVGIIGGIQYIYNSIRLFDRKPKVKKELKEKKEKTKSIIKKVKNKEDELASLLKKCLQNKFNFLVKEKSNLAKENQKINVWGEGTEDLGAHISDYKEKRGYKLILRSLVVVVIVIALNLYTSFFPSVGSFWINNIIKIILALGILSIHFSLIKSHLDDQRKTIDFLNNKNTN